jgi:flavin reductase (DIM6/NTAB) family NADH-FMN oxidoreductase RutF
MLFDFSELPAQDCYKLVVSSVVPRPIAWVVSQDGAGAVNAAPYSFFNAFSDDPVVVGFGAGPRPEGTLKDTAANIRATGSSWSAWCRKRRCRA